MYLYALMTIFSFATIVFWVSGLLLVRNEFFLPDGKRRKPLPTENEDHLYESIRAHNDGLYNDVNLFLKISLAIFGGISYLAISDSKLNNIEITLKLARFGFSLQLYTAIFTMIFILIHKRSVIYRWKNRFSWREPWIWGETWGIFFGMLFSSYAFFVAQPEILKVIKQKTKL
jgi:hypothetical protein